MRVRVRVLETVSGGEENLEHNTQLNSFESNSTLREGMGGREAGRLILLPLSIR